MDRKEFITISGIGIFAFSLGMHSKNEKTKDYKITKTNFIDYDVVRFKENGDGPFIYVFYKGGNFFDLQGGKFSDIEIGEIPIPLSKNEIKTIERLYSCRMTT